MTKLTSGKHDFSDILHIIQEGRSRGLQAANVALVETYWTVGGYLSRQVASSGWGKGVVRELADWLQTQNPELKGYSAQNLWRMKQFYEAYPDREKLSALPRELSWTHQCILLGQCKTPEERHFYATTTVRAGWSSRQLEAQIQRGAFERTVLANQKLPLPVREFPHDTNSVFKDRYLLDFLNLPDSHSESDLQAALIRNLRHFLLELGDGFAFVGEKVRLQVGNRDFELDLLFFHRDLQCLVAFELKTGQFEPEHLGQLSFYLEALDRDRKRPHENPSIGVLLCRRKDDEVVEYALSRHLSPALVAEYETKMIPKQLLRAKLHEWSELLEAQGVQEEDFS
ncbi:MAG: PDDEXK nuclease domain-containing protein [Blastocatellia bacterium]|nr:PDDEXK nuclease domain-containing protein [Blastocatellia bacterium]